MKKLHLTTLAIFIFAFSIAQESVHIDYIRAHARLAVEEMHKYKIPASIKLSQGILETGADKVDWRKLPITHYELNVKKKKKEAEQPTPIMIIWPENDMKHTQKYK